MSNGADADVVMFAATLGKLLVGKRLWCEMEWDAGALVVFARKAGDVEGQRFVVERKRIEGAKYWTSVVTQMATDIMNVLGVR